MGDGHALTLVADIASLIVNYVNGNIKESTLNHIVYTDCHRVRAILLLYYTCVHDVYVVPKIYVIRTLL